VELVVELVVEQGVVLGTAAVALSQLGVAVVVGTCEVEPEAVAVHTPP